MPKKKKLTDKRELFCREYIVDYVGTHAALRAGYSEKTAKVQASQLLRDEKILERIKELQKEACNALAVSPEYVTQRAVEGFQRCMQAEPVMIYNKETKQHEPSGQWVFDARGAAKFLEILANTSGANKKTLDLSDLNINIRRLSNTENKG